MDSAQKLYDFLQPKREPFIRRAKNNALVTNPALFPEQEELKGDDLPTPHQAVGARGYSNLSSALQMTLLPYNVPFYRFEVDGAAAQVLSDKLGVKESELDSFLSAYEHDVYGEISVSGFRTTTSQALDQLIIAGNCLVHIPDKGKTRMFRMNRYVLERDPMGNPSVLVVREDLNEKTLNDPKIKQHLADTAHQEEDAYDPHSKVVSIYTKVVWEGKKVSVHQELGHKVIEGTQGTYPIEGCPWIPVRFEAVDGEAYGRSYVERYYGDLRVLDGLSRSLTEFAAAAAKILFLVKPNSTTRIRTIAKRRSGSVVPGSGDDISVLQMEKFADFRVTKEQADTLTTRLNHAFLVTESMVRNAERVTAEEIRVLTASAQAALSGAYDLMAEEYQRPVLQRFIHRMVRSKKLKRLPKKYITPTIVAGADALGRDVELQRLDAFVLGTGHDLAVVEKYVDLGEYYQRRANLLFVSSENLVYTEEQRAEIANQQAQQQQAAQIAPKMVDAGGKLAQEAMKQNPTPTE